MSALKSDPGDLENDEDKVYSSFWPVWLVFLTLVVLQSIYIVEDVRERSQIKAAATQLTEPFKRAETVNQMTEAVGRELLALSTNSREAGKIIAEFKIQVNQPPQAPK